MEIIISSNTGKPIYEQITSQIKAMIMSGELKTGDPIPSMRALARSIHVSVSSRQRWGGAVLYRHRTRIFTRKNSSGRPKNICRLPPTLPGPAAFRWKHWSMS